ncbi:MAG: hypothetical protein ABIS39_06635 [Sphingomicrobium sp.]
MRDRDLVRLYWPVELRPAFDALFAIDNTLGEIVANATQSALGAIRLAWWREALVRLDTAPPPLEPRLQAVAEHLLPRGISGAMLGGIEDSWATLLDEEPDADRVAGRGERLFTIGAALLAADDVKLGEAGRLFALGDVARRGLLECAAPPNSLAGHRFPRRLRPLTLLAKLAARDLRQGWPPEPQATPGRATALLSHRLFGTIA